MSPFGYKSNILARGIVSSSLEASKPLSKWELAQEVTERQRLREMDNAFCAALAAAIKRGKEKEPNARSIPT